MKNAPSPTPTQTNNLLQVLQRRYEAHPHRHPAHPWSAVQAALQAQPQALHTLHAMESSGGEPDVVDYDPQQGRYWYCDCATESPLGRRSLCYDQQALDARKENKPADSAQGMAAAMGALLLDEAQYRHLQTLGEFDLKTSSWIVTPPDIRAAGGALFADRRYGHVFVYHNGASSYYAARGFRAGVWV